MAAAPRILPEEMLLEQWLKHEQTALERLPEPDAEDLEEGAMVTHEIQEYQEQRENHDKIRKRQPTRQKKRRKIETAPGDVSDYEEYLDFLFPDDTGAEKNLAILQAAQAWKKKKMQMDN